MKLASSPVRGLAAWFAIHCLAGVLLFHAWPAAAAAFLPLDLGAFANTTNADSAHLGPLPARLTVREVPFTLGPAARVTGLDAARKGDYWPDARRGLAVGRKAARLHLLLGAFHGRRDGEPLANVVLHFRDGEPAALRVAYGLHTRNVLLDRDAEDAPLADPNARLAWQTNAGRFHARLHHAVFDNPRPGEQIVRLDFVSLFGDATPVLFAVTLQDDAAPALQPLPKTKIIQRAAELADAALRRELIIRATDDQNRPLPGANVVLSVADDAQDFFLGEFSAGTDGRATLPCPPQAAVRLTARAEHAGFAPATARLERHAAAAWPGEMELRLERGRTIGGIVADRDQKPVVDAEVRPASITATGPNEFTREDFSVVKTGPDGRWTASVPPSVTNLSVSVTHPDFHPVNLSESMEEFLSRSVLAMLDPHVRLAGRVLDANGRPVPNAAVLFYDEDQDTRRTMNTDAEGRYKFIVLDPDNRQGHLVVTADNFGPAQRSTRLDRPAASLDFTLGPAQPFAMRLTDGEGAPLADTQVTLTRWEKTQALAWQTLTDAQGRFTWANAPTGSVTWRFYKVGSINHSHSMTLPQRGEEQFVYQRPLRIAGRVLDAVTRRPLDSFRYRVRYSYTNGNGTTSGIGRRGSFATTLGPASTYTNVTVHIEAGEYEPLAVELKRPYGAGTNEYLMQKAKLLEAAVVTRDGRPAPGTEVLLLDKTASAYMDEPGKFRRTSGNYDVAVADDAGRVGLTPRPEADLVLAAHPQLGFAQIATNEFLKTGRIVLEPWGVVKGVLRVGPRVEPDQFVAIHTHYIYDGVKDRSPAPLYLYYRLEPEPDGQFLCAAVPPGERMVQLRYYAPNESGVMRLSHNQPVTVRPGATNDVLIGGTGRTVTGQVTVENAPGAKIDGKRGEFLLRLLPGPQPSEIPPPFSLPPRVTPQERQRLMAEHQEKIREVARNRARTARLAQRQYVLRFDDANRFTAHHIPPGQYTLMLTPQDPNAPRGVTRTLGSLSRTVVIPEGTAPFDLGPSTIPARGGNP
jgi:hypothetical protein